MNTTFQKLSMKALCKIIRAIRRQMRHVEVKDSVPSVTYIVTGIKVRCATYEDGKVYSLHPISEAISNTMTLFMDSDGVVRMLGGYMPDHGDIPPKKSIAFVIAI